MTHCSLRHYCVRVLVCDGVATDLALGSHERGPFLGYLPLETLPEPLFDAVQGALSIGRAKYMQRFVSIEA